MGQTLRNMVSHKAVPPFQIGRTRMVSNPRFYPRAFSDQADTPDRKMLYLFG
jgi:hypothetical protein